MKKLFTPIRFFTGIAFLFVASNLNAQTKLSEGFEGTFPPAGWLVVNDTIASTTWMKNTAVFHSGTASALNDFDCTYSDNDWLITPQLSVSAGDSLTFWYRTNDSGWPPDSLAIKISTLTSSTSDFTTTIALFQEGVNYPPLATWQYISLSLNSYAGQNIFIAFKQFDNCGDGIFVDDVFVGQPSANDVGVIAFNAPTSNCSLTAAEAVTIKVKNFGTAAQDTTPVSYSINGGPAVNDTVFVNILAGDTATFTFNVLADLSIPGTYSIDAWTNLLNDASNANDSILNYSVQNGVISLTTTFAGGNGSNGNMFDVVAIDTVTIKSFEGNLNAGTGTVEIWYRPGSFVGFETGNIGWTQVGSAAVTSAGPGSGTAIPVNVNVVILPGDTVAFYVTSTNGVAYTNGTSLGNVFVSDAKISVLEGNGGGYFSVINSPRVFNGVIHYSCEGPLTDNVGVIAIDAPTSGCGLTAAEAVTVRVKNFGIAAQDTIPVSYSINGGPAVNDTVFVNILAGDTATFTFNVLADLSLPGTYIIDAWTNLLNDADNTNDSLNGYVVNNIPPSLSFNDSIYISDAIPGGIKATICTNGLVSNMLDNCYQLTAVVIDSLSHTWTSDLLIYLISPNNDTLELSTNNGGSGDNYYNVVFTDTAPINISTVTTGGFGAGGYYHTEDTVGLSSFTGFDPNGAWNLWITDDAGGDEGAIYEWHLEFTYFTTVVNIGADFAMCDGESAILDAGIPGAVSYMWNTGDTTQTITVDTAGMYIVEVNKCGTDIDTIIVTVNPVYSDSASATICDNDSLQLPGGAYVNTAGIYYDTLASVNGCDSVIATTLTVNPTYNTTATEVICSGDSIFLQGNYQTTAGTYYDTLASVNGCDSVIATNLLVITTLVIDLGPDITMCDGEVAVLDAGIPGADSYLWNTGDTTQTITTDTAGTFTVEVNKCGTDIDTIIVIVNLTYSINASANICDNDSLQLPGGAYVSTAGIYYDTLTAVNGCDSVIATTLAVTTAPNAGISDSVEVCGILFATFNLPSGLGGTPDGGGTWNDDDATGAIIPFTSIVSLDITGTGTFNFTYTVSGTPPCTDASATVTLTISAPPAGTDGSLSACVLETALDLFTGLGGSPDSTGTWNDDDATGALTGSVFNPSTPGPGVYNFTYTVAGPTPCADTTATVTVTVVSTPSAGTDGTLNVCATEFAVDLSTGLGGTPDAGGTWNDDDGTGALAFGFFSAFTTGAGTYHFTYIVSASGCANDSATVTVNVTAAPDAGTDSTLNIVSGCVVTLDLFTVLGGTPDVGGTWLDDDASGALSGSVFNPSAVSPATYKFTYIVAGTGGCANDSATVTVPVSTCTGISEMLSSALVKIYPNPNKGKFIVEFTNTKKDDYLIEVRNIIGQLIFTEQVEDIPGNFTKEIDLSGHKGVYFLSISTGSGKRTEKLVVY